MLIPRYFFSDDYAEFYDYFLSKPHRRRVFEKGDMIWNLGETIRYVYYIETGIAKTFVEHENGYHKILHFHSNGTVFPGCQNSAFKIEASMGTEALTRVETLEFTREDFYQMYQENMSLNACVLETYSMYINLFVYESAHQDYNNAFIKVCNLLYLFSLHSPTGTPHRIELTQQEIADTLAISLVNVTTNLAKLRNNGIIVSHRKWIEITDFPKLVACCSNETINT